MSERNLLIEAGAGTGKTTRLVKAVLQALFIRQLPLETIVAPNGCSGVQRVPNAGHSCGFFKPCKIKPAIHSAGSSTL